MTTNMLTLAILLPISTGPSQFHVRAKEGGRELELAVQWPVRLTDI